MIKFLFLVIAAASIFAFSPELSAKGSSQGKETSSKKSTKTDADKKSSDDKEHEDKDEECAKDQDNKKDDKDDASKKDEKNDDENNDKKEEIKPLEVGNFALPSSQQPGPLISFGQNIIEQGQVQAFVMADYFRNKDGYTTIIAPSFVYAFRDDLTIFAGVPIYPKNREDENHSSGCGDAFIQFEYAYYSNQQTTYLDQATLVTNITIPTGSSKKNPTTGFGANSFFLGGTISRLAIDWYYFVEAGGIWVGKSHGTQFGNQFLYQAGIGKNICYSKEWIFLWMVEMDGYYSWKDIIDNATDPNSGGNVIYVTPSIWLSSQHLILQLGAGYAVYQNLNGNQPRNDWLLALNLGWTF